MEKHWYMCALFQSESCRCDITFYHGKYVRTRVPTVVVDGNHSLAASIKDWREQADGRQSAVKCLLSDEAALAMVPLVAS